MNSLSKFSVYSVALISSMSLLMVVGCSGNENVKHSLDAGITDVVPEENKTSAHADEISVESKDTPDLEILMADVMPDVKQPKEINAGNEEQMSEQVVVDESNIEPEKKIVSFAFDQSAVISDYGDMLWQHAQYLRQNSDLVLHVSGHTDESGARLYNESLSKKRAEEVAQVLIDFGAPKEQIKIIGLASDQPLVGAKTHREHRRVELDYQQQQIVSN